MAFPEHFVYHEPGGRVPWVPVEDMLDFLNAEFAEFDIMTVPDDAYFITTWQNMYTRWGQTQPPYHYMDIQNWWGDKRQQILAHRTAAPFQHPSTLPYYRELQANQGNPTPFDHQSHVPLNLPSQTINQAFVPATSLALRTQLPPQPISDTLSIPDNHPFSFHPPAPQNMAAQHAASNRHPRSTSDTPAPSNSSEIVEESASSALMQIDQPVASSSGLKQPTKAAKQHAVNMLAQKLYSQESGIDWQSLVDEQLRVEQKTERYRLDTRRTVLKEYWEQLDEEEKERYIKQAKQEVEKQSQVELSGDEITKKALKRFHKLSTDELNNNVASLVVLWVPGIGKIGQTSIQGVSPSEKPQFIDWLRAKSAKQASAVEDLLAEYGSSLWADAAEAPADSDEDDDEGEGEAAEQVVKHLKFEKNTRVANLRVLLRDSLKERWSHAGRKDKISWKDISLHPELYCNSSVLPSFWDFSDPTHFNQNTLLGMLEYLKSGDDGSLPEQCRFKWYTTTPTRRPRTATTSKARAPNSITNTVPLPAIVDEAPAPAATLPIATAGVDATSARADTAPTSAPTASSSTDNNTTVSASIDAPTTTTTTTDANPATESTTVGVPSFRHVLNEAEIRWIQSPEGAAAFAKLLQSVHDSNKEGAAIPAAAAATTTTAAAAAATTNPTAATTTTTAAAATNPDTDPTPTDPAPTKPTVKWTRQNKPSAASLALAVKLTTSSAQNKLTRRGGGYDYDRDDAQRDFFATSEGQEGLAHMYDRVAARNDEEEEEEEGDTTITIKQELDAGVPTRRTLEMPPHQSVLSIQYDLMPPPVITTALTPAASASAPPIPAPAKKGGKRTKAIASEIYEELTPVEETAGKKKNGRRLAIRQQPASEAKAEPPRRSARPKRKARDGDVDGADGADGADVQVEAEVTNKRRRGA